MSGKTLAFVQARVGSTRLPGKTLADVAGRPLVVRVVERLRRSSALDDVVVLTSSDGRDSALRDLCEEQGIPVIAGSEQDVLARFTVGLDELNPSHVVRITADCPLIDPGVVTDLVSMFHETEGCDYAAVATGAMAAAAGRRRFPDGLDAEMVSAEALRTASLEAADPYEREHVTPFIWRRPERFKIARLQAPEDRGAERWTVDYAADLDFVRAVYERLAGVPEFDWTDVLALLEREPQLREINAGPRDSARPVF